MRFATTIFAILLFVATTTAQRPWGEYSARQHERILASRSLPDEVREAYHSPHDITFSERERLFDIITMPTHSKRHVSLYIELYERLRAEDGSDATTDVAMLNRYTRPMLTLWSNNDNNYTLYNYAYAIAAYAAHNDSEELLHAITQRVRHKASAGARHEAKLFAMVANGVYGSVLCSRGLHVDHTPIPTSEVLARSISHDRYLSSPSLYQPIATTAIAEDGTDNDDTTRAATIASQECIAWNDGYYTLHPAHEELYAAHGITTVHYQRASDAYVIISDYSGECYTLPHNLYILPNGKLYAISTNEARDVEYVVVGGISEGVVTIRGSIPIEHGTLCDAKCNNEGVMLRVLHDGQECYYLISTTE